VTVDPEIRQGYPCVGNVRTLFFWEQWARLGEPVEYIAEDLGRSREQVIAAVSFERELCGEPPLSAGDTASVNRKR
jgi:uncharacterized protein (DUF433 family)